MYALKPARLQPGDTIGIITPSFGGPAFFPHRMERGIAYLESLGYRTKVGTHAWNAQGFVADTPENRVADLHAMFADAEVKAIVSSIGGDHSCHLLPLIDFDLIRANPKIFMGYSDITVLNVALYQQTGLITFNGPALMTDFAEYPTMMDYTSRWLWPVITRAEPVGAVEPAESWTEEFLDWGQQLDLTCPRALLPNPGWNWLKPGSAEGVLIGGCIESLQHLRGTPYWPGWENAILFFETSEEKPTPARLDGILMDYENMGVLAQLKGLLVGRPMSYTDAEKAELRAVILERTRRYDFPIITDMDFGHTTPQMTLPIGCRARISPGRFELIEAAVAEV